jgi:hypothetical protein
VIIGYVFFRNPRIRYANSGIILTINSTIRTIMAPNLVVLIHKLTIIYTIGVSLKSIILGVSALHSDTQDYNRLASPTTPEALCLNILTGLIPKSVN